MVEIRTGRVPQEDEPEQGEDGGEHELGHCGEDNQQESADRLGGVNQRCF